MHRRIPFCSENDDVIYASLLNVLKARGNGIDDGMVKRMN